MSEAGSARIRLQARDVMTADVITVRPDTTVKDIAAVMLAHHVSGLPVITPEGELTGIVTEADLLYKESERHRDGNRFWLGLSPFGRRLETMRKAAGITAADVMSTPVVTVQEDMSLHEVAALMVRRKINRVPVLRSGRLAGIISRADILRAFVRPDEEIARAVREALQRELWLNVALLKVDVKDGIVRIGGEVDRRSEKEFAERWVAAIDGVLGVESALTYRSDDLKIPERYATTGD